MANSRDWPRRDYDPNTAPAAGQYGIGRQKTKLPKLMALTPVRELGASRSQGTSELRLRPWACQQQPDAEDQIVPHVVDLFLHRTLREEPR